MLTPCSSVPKCSPVIPNLAELLRQVNADRQVFDFIKRSESTKAFVRTPADFCSQCGERSATMWLSSPNRLPSLTTLRVQDYARRGRRLRCKRPFKAIGERVADPLHACKLNKSF